MSDARALLRSERAARRINHPLAVYSRNGSLSCSACQLPIKSESLWELHLKSRNHILNAQKSSQQPSESGAKHSLAPAAATAGQKRKGRDRDDDDEDDNGGGGDDDRMKRPRPSAVSGKELPAGFFDRPDEVATEAVKRAPTNEASINADVGPEGGQADDNQRSAAVNNNNDDDDASARPHPPRPESLSPSAATAASLHEFHTSQTSELPSRPHDAPQISRPAASPAGSVDEAEWAAFERDVATPPPPPPPVMTAAATIEAAPLSADDVVAQARLLQSRRREERDAEIEAEKEDAARKLEAEFEEMEALEARVRKLRDMREALRRDQVAEKVDDTSGAGDGAGDATLGSAAKETRPTGSRADEAGEESESDASDDSDDWEGWRLRS